MYLGMCFQAYLYMSLLQVLVPCSAQMATQNASVQNSPAALLNQLVKAVLNEDEGKLHMF